MIAPKIIILASCAAVVNSAGVAHRCGGKAVYDYVIVGGGASGLTVADRLTEDPNVSVLVLEHGQFDHQELAVTVPGLLNLSSPTYYFPLTTVPQHNLNNRTFAATAGRGVGGSTLINGLLFDRGSHADYDAWSQLGNKGWSWRELLPYFKKSEMFSPPTSDFVHKWNITYDLNSHGTDGPVQSSFPRFQYPSCLNFLKAWISLGISANIDPVAGSKAGVFIAPSSLNYQNQSRSYARSAHYDRVIERRKNYCVMSKHTVTRILIEKDRATGVEYVAQPKNRTLLTAMVSKEVIIAAGVYNTPKILQHSGIGPADILSKIGVPIIKDLPGVGFNLQDHPTYYGTWNLTNLPFPTQDDIDSNQSLQRQVLEEYLTSRTGPYTVAHFGGNALAFLPLSEVTSDTTAIHNLAQSTDTMQIYPLNTSKNVIRGYEAQKDALLKILRHHDNPVLETGYGGRNVVPVTIMHPFSRGTVLINSTDPLKQALIDYRVYNAPVDLKLMVASIRKTRTMMQTPMMQELGTGEISPGSSRESGPDLESAIKENGLPGYQHGCCSCAMMPQQLGGVVDNNLKVYGIQNLRLVDASIMPIIPASHLSTTVYAVAEKAADLIKSEHSVTNIWDWFSSYHKFAWSSFQDTMTAYF